MRMSMSMSISMSNVRWVKIYEVEYMVQLRELMMYDVVGRVPEGQEPAWPYLKSTFLFQCLQRQILLRQWLSRPMRGKPIENKRRACLLTTLVNDGVVMKAFASVSAVVAAAAAAACGFAACGHIFRRIYFNLKAACLSLSFSFVPSIF